MKIRFYKIFVLGLTILISNYFSGCSKDKCIQQPDQTFLMSSSDKAQIIYSGRDTLKFLHNAIDTIVFIGQGKQSYFNVEPGTGGDCPGANQKYEGYDIIYMSSQFSSKIFFSQHLYLSGGSEVTVDFNNSKFGYSSTDIRLAKDSINIFNQTYYNECVFYTYSNKTDTLYFNKSVGVLKISTLSDKWEIVK